MNEPSSPPRWLPPLPLIPSGMGPALLVSFLFGSCIIFSRGAYSEPALFFVVMALLVIVFWFQDALRTPFTLQVGTRMFAPLVFVGLFGMVFVQWNDPHVIIYPRRPWELGRFAQVAWLFLLLSYVPFFVTRLAEETSLKRLRFGLFAIVLLIGGYDTIRASPRPIIDAWTVQQEGAAYLLQGENPFQKVAVRDTGPRDASDVPYTYPPTQLYLTTPAYKFGGDVRWTMLLSLLISGIALRYITGKSKLALPSILEDAPTLFLWLMPKLFFILEQSWVDPVQVMLITVATAIHLSGWPIATAVAFGVVASSKQTMFWMIPLVGVILRFNLKQWVIAAAAGSAMVLPWVIWDFRALKHANFEFLSALPSRPDALTIVNWVYRKFELVIPGALGFGMAAIAAGLSLWKLRGSTAGFALAALSTYTFFFAFNKWAFANYYFLLASLAALAAATAGHFAVGAVVARPVTAEGDVTTVARVEETPVASAGEGSAQSAK